MILLDTHVWLWWLLGDGNLSDNQRSILNGLASKKQLALSWVSVWELEMLERKQRVHLVPNFHEWTKTATDSSFIQLIGVDSELVFAQRSLPEKFHTDPADRLIATTSIVYKYPLATFDRKIIESGSVAIWNEIQL